MLQCCSSSKHGNRWKHTLFFLFIIDLALWNHILLSAFAHIPAWIQTWLAAHFQNEKTGNLRRLGTDSCCCICKVSNASHCKASHLPAQPRVTWQAGLGSYPFWHRNTTNQFAQNEAFAVPLYLHEATPQKTRNSHRIEHVKLKT